MIHSSEYRIGQQVSGQIFGQQFTGTVSSLGLHAHGGYVDGPACEVTSVSVATDQPLTTPAGRQVSRCIFRGEAEISRLAVIPAGGADRVTAEIRRAIG
jgi:hypothetical protein